MTDKITLTDSQGNTVQVDAEFVFGEAGDEAPIPFAIDGEVFYAASTIPADEHGRLAQLFAALPSKKEGQDTSPEEVDATIKLILEMMELFLLPESTERLAARLGSKERPVGIQRLMEVAGRFLNEVYGGKKQSDDEDEAVTAGRPTPPTSA